MYTLRFTSLQMHESDIVEDASTTEKMKTEANVLKRCDIQTTIWQPQFSNVISQKHDNCCLSLLQMRDSDIPDDAFTTEHMEEANLGQMEV